MGVYGYVERHSASQISGWCHDVATSSPASVVLCVDGIELYRVRADISRPDLVKHFGSDLGGFSFGLGPRLRSLLPDGSRISVVANGKTPLGFVKGVTDRITNPDCTSLEQLKQKFAEGLRVSPKSGELYRPLGSLDNTDSLLADFDYCRDLLKKELGWELLLGYGTLLGAVREGDFIAHDDDIDGIFYVPTATTYEAACEFKKFCDRLSALGERIRIVRSGQIHWFARHRSVDIFMGWFDKGILYSYCAGGVTMTAGDLAPVPYPFKGRTMQVPRSYEKILEATYGPGWRVPDPYFQWRLSASVAAEMAALQKIWLEMTAEGSTTLATQNATPSSISNAAQSDAATDSADSVNQPAEQVGEHWERFYRHWSFAVPSQFAALVATELETSHAVLELGCGNGRDAAFFAAQGHQILALDASEQAILANRARAEQLGLADRLLSERVRVGAPGELVDRIQSLAARCPSLPIAVYARFFFHAIPSAEESIIIEELGCALPVGSRCFFEFRSSRDAATPKVFGSHYRRYIDLDDFTQCCAKVGLVTRYRVVGQGMAKFRDEDPWVARVVLVRAD